MIHNEQNRTSVQFAALRHDAPLVASYTDCSAAFSAAMTAGGTGAGVGAAVPGGVGGAGAGVHDAHAFASACGSSHEHSRDGAPWHAPRCGQGTAML
tara:strand:+ start:881 stop:1171 length:291 start_codon:yes stop_codon:yes gene_type:complete